MLLKPIKTTATSDPCGNQCIHSSGEKLSVFFLTRAVFSQSVFSNNPKTSPKHTDKY